MGIVSRTFACTVCRSSITVSVSDTNELGYTMSRDQIEYALRREARLYGYVFFATGTIKCPECWQRMPTQW